MDKEKLIKHIDYYLGGSQPSHYSDNGLYTKEGVIYAIRDFDDEEEVLSHEWIDEHVDYADVRGGTQAFIHVEDLRNLLVPKQEEPNDDLYILMLNGGFVTDFELEAGRVVGLERQSDYDASVVMGTRPFMEFIQKQVGGELHNITNPEEQKYYVLGKHDTPILFRDYKNRITETSNLSDIYPKANSEDFEFTEKEIKDYDPRYMTFAKPVEELE